MIIGHQKIVNFIERSIEKDMISQAYLFSGPEHLGKFSLALDFARRLAGGKDSKINPDIIIIAPETEEKKEITKKKDIKIESIRELQKKLSLTAYFGKYKTAIIDDAERLTVSAQNALLKTLEEAEKNCVLILVCHNPDKILPTIRSRCLIKKFSLVKEKEISEIIGEENNKEEIVFWSFGRPGMAMNLQKDGEMEKRRGIKNDFKKILESNLNDKFILADNLSKDQDSLTQKMRLWMAIIRENMLRQSKFFPLTPEKALILIEEIGKSLDTIQNTNANSKIVLENLFLKF